MPPPPAPDPITTPVTTVSTWLSPSLHSPHVPDPSFINSPSSNSSDSVKYVHQPSPSMVDHTSPLLGQNIHIIYDQQYANEKEQQDLVLPLRALTGPHAIITPWVLTQDNAFDLAHRIPKDGVVVLHADLPPGTAIGGKFTALRTLLREAKFPRVLGHFPDFCERTVHKSVMNAQFKAAGIPHTDSVVIHNETDIHSPTVLHFVQKLLSSSGTKLFLKVDGGFNSTGLNNSNVISTIPEFYEQSQFMVRKYGPIIVQRYINGREFTVAVCSSPTGTQVFHPVERIFAPGQLFSPPDGTLAEQLVNEKDEPKLVQECRRLTGMAYEAVGGLAWGRVDLRCDDQGNVYVLEVNNTASFGPNSYFAISTRAQGIEREQVLDMVVRATWLNPPNPNTYTE